jgi:hypothetical protein
MGRPFTEQLKEGQAIAGADITTLNSGGTASVLTSAINMANMRRARAFLHCGSLAGASSIDFRLQASATEGGAYTNITLTTTAVALTAITTDNSWNAIEIRADQMPAGKPWLKAYVENTAAADAVVDVFIVGDCAQYSPGNQEDSVTWTNNVVGSSQAN